MPSAAKIAANRRNWAKRRGLTPEGRQRLREAALRNQPWKHATGPRTAAGKRRSRMNAVTHGADRAEQRAVEAWLRSLVVALSHGNQLLDARRDDERLAHAEALAVTGSHLCSFPAQLDTETATAWLRKLCQIRQ